MNECGIYKITNIINGHSYIGQSTNIARRWSEHKSRYQEQNSTLYKAFRKYGINNFTFEIIEECSPELLDEKEIYYIAKYNTFHEGYNETIGGGNNYTSSVEPEYVQLVRFDLANTTLLGIDIAKKYNISDQMVSDINQGRAWTKYDIKYPIREKTTREQRKICPVCGGAKSIEAEMCISCRNKINTSSKKPPRDELVEKIYYSSFAAVAREYGVSDKAVSKWCASYGLPSKIKELRAWYEEKKGITKIVHQTQKTQSIREVIQIDPKTQEIVAIYHNLHEAGRALGNENYRKHIGDVCNGHRKTAYGYIWKYKE